MADKFLSDGRCVSCGKHYNKYGVYPARQSPHPDPAEEIARLKEAIDILINAVEHVRHAGGMGFDGKGFDRQIADARATLGGSSPAQGEGK